MSVICICVAGLQRVQKGMFQANWDKHMDKLRNMKPNVDTSAPKKLMLVQPRHKRSSLVQREKEIDAENMRLLKKMTQIYERGEKESVQVV